MSISPSPASDNPIPVRVRPPSRIQQPARVAASGSVDTEATVNLAFQVAGRIRRVLVEEGRTVRKGQVVAELDATDYRLGVEAAKAQTAAARAQAAKAQAGPRKQDVELARIQFDRAEDEYRRMKFLYERKSLAPNDFKKVEAVYLAARQQYDTAREGTRIEDRHAADAQVEQAVAGEQLAEKHLSDTVLRSPINGSVARRGTEVGEMVGAGTPIFTLIDVERARIRVGVPESDISQVRIGQRASISVAALGGRMFSGFVEIVGTAGEPTSRAFTVKIGVANPGGILKAGMIAEAQIDTDRQTNALTVPGDSIQHDPQGATFVWVYYPQQKRVHARRVEAGSVFGREVEVRGGLQGDEQVVVAGQSRLREGSAVEAGQVAP